jgi:hypothetical protein
MCNSGLPTHTESFFHAFQKFLGLGDITDDIQRIHGRILRGSLEDPWGSPGDPQDPPEGSQGIPRRNPRGSFWWIPREPPGGSLGILLGDPLGSSWGIPRDPPGGPEDPPEAFLGNP